MAGAQIVAVTSFTANVSGESLVVHAGDVYAAVHPLAKACSDLFTPREQHNVTSVPVTRRRKAKT
jgi:hypothetical protein